MYWGAEANFVSTRSIRQGRKSLSLRKEWGIFLKHSLLTGEGEKSIGIYS